MVFEFFAYWNGAQMRDLFEAVVAIVGAGDFSGLVRTVTLLGILCVLTVAAFRYRGMDAMSFIVAVVFFYAVTLVPKTTVVIQDERATDVYTVDGVPLGLAFLASGTSHVGHWLTQSFENTFTHVEAERFSRFGMVFPQRALNALLAAGPVTPEGRSLVSHFNRACVVPELIESPAKLNDVTDSGNLWGTISAPGWVNPARQTQGLNGSWLACDEAVTQIEAFFTQTEVPAIERFLAMKLVPEAVDPSAVIVSALPQAESLLLGLSQDLSTSIKHSVFLNTLDDDLAGVAALSQNPLAVATKLAKAQGNLASELNYRTMSQIAQDALPKVRNALQFVILASFPLIFILMMAMGPAAGLILRNYATLLIWIELWAPISAVINYLIVHVDAHPMNQIIAQYGANSMMAATLIRETGASSQAIAGYLMILAPIIAFAIAKGSDMATSQMVASIMAPAQSAAQSQGASITQGNISLGNASWGNVSTNNHQANKSDLSTAFTASDMLTTQNAYGSVTRNATGVVTGMQATGISTGVNAAMGLGSSANQTAQSSLTSGMSYADAVQGLSRFTTQTADKSTAGFASMLSNALNTNQGLAQTHTNTQAVSETLSAGYSSTLNESLTNSEQFAYQSQLGFQVSAGSGDALPQTPSTLSTPSIASSGLAAVKPSMKGGLPLDRSASSRDSLINAESSVTKAAQLSMGPALAISNTQNLVHQATGTASVADSRQRQEAYQTLLAASRQVAASTTDAGIRSAAESFESQLTAAYQYANGQSFETRASQQASRSLGQVTTQDIRTMMDANPLALMRAIETFGSAEKAQSALFHSAEARSQFAQRLQADLQGQNLTPSTPLPLNPAQIDRMGALHRSDFESELQKTLQSHQSANRLESFTAQHDAVGRSAGLAPDLSQVQRIVRHQRQRTEDHFNQMEDEVMQERGQNRSARAFYEDREKGAGTVFDNALLGGMTYHSPHDYRREMQTMSEKDPHNANGFKALGDKAESTTPQVVESSLQRRR